MSGGSVSGRVSPSASASAAAPTWQKQPSAAHSQAGGSKAEAAAETNALNLRWCFGFNSRVANTVHSLRTPTRDALLYVSAHTAVIHDLASGTQRLLQGHCNPVTSVAVSKDKRWVATADFGPDAMIVIWDAIKATPVRIIPQSEEEGGVASMDLSSDAMFLATISYNYPQVLSIWEWPSSASTPLIRAPIGPRDYQHCIRFNPVDVRDIVTNGSGEVIFWSWTDSHTITAFHPPKGLSKLKKSLRNLSQSAFIPYTTKAVTATTSGHVVAWDYPVSELVQSTGRDAIKILKLVKSGILLLDTVLDRFLVCGCSDGAVRFFDFQFRVVAWFEDLHAGSICSISFAESSVGMPNNAAYLGGGGGGGGGSNSTNGGQISMEEFAVPDFVVATASGKILALDSKTMEHLTADKRRGKLLVQGFDDEVHALDAHPRLPVFVVGTLRGSLQVWDMDERRMVASRKFESGEISHATGVGGSGTGSGKDGTSGTNKNRALLTATTAASGKKFDATKAGSNGISGSSTTTTGGAGGTTTLSKDDLVNDSNQVTCVKFSPKSGHLLAIGFSNGFVKVVSMSESTSANNSHTNAFDASGSGTSGAPSLRDVCNFHRSEQAITHISFSPDGSYLATSDAQGCIALYRYWHRDEDLDKPVEWIYIGKHRSHYRPIVSVFFEAPILTPAQLAQQRAMEEEAAALAAHQAEQEAGQQYGVGGGREESKESSSSPAQQRSAALATLSAATSSLSSSPSSLAARLAIPRLYSLGEDRVLQEYDLAASSIRAGLKIKSSARMEQTACPTAVMSMPSRNVPASSTVAGSQSSSSSKQTPDLLITANDEYKLKIWEILHHNEEPHIKNPLLAALSAQSANLAAAIGASGGRTSTNMAGGGGAGASSSKQSSSTLAAGGKKSAKDMNKSSGVGGGLKRATSTSGGGTAWSKDTDAAAASSSFSPSSHPDLFELGHRKQKLRKTLLAPMYGGCINKIFSLAKRDTTSSSTALLTTASNSAASGKSQQSTQFSGIIPSEYLVYSTFEKVVGLIKLPLDGNPTKSMALIAHPGEVSNVVSSFDGKYVLTAGGSDRSIHLWSVSTAALDASITLGGSGISPYLTLIEGGVSGEFFQELLDYFYYAQLRQQGLATTSPREITGKISVEEAINMMRALGFYPTEQQVQQMKDEVRFENESLFIARAKEQAAQQGQVFQSRPIPGAVMDSLDLDAFIKLYINHRPVFGIGPKAFEQAFDALSQQASSASASSGGGDVDDTTSARSSNGDAPAMATLSSEQLIHQLMTLGDEPMSVEEIEHALDALLGDTPNPKDATELQGKNDLSAAMKRILRRLPAQVSPHRFASDILGFDDYVPPQPEADEQQQQQQRRTKDEDDEGENEEEKEQTTIVISQH